MNAVLQQTEACALVPLAIIVPVLNEGEALTAAMQALAPLRARGALVVLSDGGSTDDSIDQASAHVDRVVAAPRGRARQMNAGARSVNANAYLFLHADTALPHAADEAILAALHSAPSSMAWGSFAVRLRSTRRSLAVVQQMMNWRSRLTGICTGDQALFMTRALFDSLGGFAPIALMEDIEFCRRARRLSAPIRLPLSVTTSARRWESNGVWRTIRLMWRLRFAYFRGANPSLLAQRYGYDQREPAQFHVAVLAKAPVPGLAKTRLIPALGEAGSARLARSLLLQTLGRCNSYPTVLWCAPDRQARFFRALARKSRIPMRDQPTGDIGQRMAQAAEHHFNTSAQHALLIVGTDCPAMTPQHLLHAAQALNDHEVVLIPAQDGGYVLIGMRRANQELFSRIDWSTPLVMQQTRARLQELALPWAELATLWDIDTPDDLQRLESLEKMPLP